MDDKKMAFRIQSRAMLYEMHFVLHTSVYRFCIQPEYSHIYLFLSQDGPNHLLTLLEMNNEPCMLSDLCMLWICTQTRIFGMFSVSASL